MTIKDTNDPKALKKYVRYVVEKYHELANSYIAAQDKIVSLSSDLVCVKMERDELKNSIKLYVEEIKHLYQNMGNATGNIETANNFLDTMATDMLELKDTGALNNIQLNLFDACDEPELLVEFNEVNLVTPIPVIVDAFVDKDIQTKQ